MAKEEDKKMRGLDLLDRLLLPIRTYVPTSEGSHNVQATGAASHS